MKLPKNYFDNLSTSKYREYLKLLPSIHQEHTKAIIMLIFTFIALSFFGVFAINPTLTTIVELQKQAKDNEAVLDELNTKVSNLSTLQQQYAQITADLPLIYEAIPQNADAALLVGQIEALAKQYKITLTDVRVPQVELSGKDIKDTQGSSFTFSLEAEGSYQQLSGFAADIAHFNRLVSIESITIQKPNGNDTLVMQMQARAYFKK